jgi:glycosyltransferase involved in cell wall biosynthesis
MRMLGLPVVATPTEAYREAVIDGIDGFLAHNTHDWIDKIGRLITDVDLRERVGNAGRAKAIDSASFSRIWPQWIKVFSSLKGRKDKIFSLKS